MRSTLFCAERTYVGLSQVYGFKHPTPLRFVAWCSKNVPKVHFHAIRVFLAILVERKTPLISTKGILTEFRYLYFFLK